MLEKTKNCQSLVENKNHTSKCTPMEYPDDAIPNKTIEKPAMASEFTYRDSVIFVFHRIRSPLGQ